MKIRLKLTRAQYKGLATIAQNCCSVIRGEGFAEVQYRDALMGLTLRLAAKVPRLKEKGNGVTLGELESLVLWRTVSDLVEQMQPFEMGLGYMLLGEIDRQRMGYVNLMRSNCVPAEGNYLSSRL